MKKRHTYTKSQLHNLIDSTNYISEVNSAKINSGERYLRTTTAKS
jgi:hypothetical protein